MLTKNAGIAILAIAMTTSLSLANAATGDVTFTGVELMTTTSAITSTGITSDVFKIDKVDASVAKTIDLLFTKSVAKDSADIKVMEDNRISSAENDATDTKKVKITLDEDVKLASSYSLFLVSGPEGFMSFDLGAELSTGAISNTETAGEQNISSITFIDAKTIEVTFKADVAGTAEFKLLREVATESTTVIDNKVSIMTKEDMSSTKSYTLTIASLKDAEGTDIDAENSVYDFNYTGTDTTALADTASGELNSASGVTGTGVDTIAPQAKELPGTGTKENLIFLASLLLSLFVVLYYRKKLAR